MQFENVDAMRMNVHIFFNVCICFFPSVNEYFTHKAEKGKHLIIQTCNRTF